ncbi:GntR family transcriptional regulator [Caenimonas terrae]|uniref:GntR family transcriptional regulator n=1 Tax=Caenimonas terrae TaxID=696074 RepID=A0ABW0NDN3_9BURK
MSSTLPLPKYHRIYLVLREQLADGCFSAGLPGELALMDQFGVARVTVRRALEQLAGEGLITRQPGRGTHPVDGGARAALPAAATDTGLTGLLENIVSMSLHTSVRVLALDTVPASPAVAAALGVAPGHRVQKAVRMRSTREGPLSHITTYVPTDVARPFRRRELSGKPILLLLEEAGVKVGRAEQTISARLADAEVAQRLQVAVGSALLAVRRVVFDDHERPVQWLHGLYRPDRYEYQMQLSRVGAIDAKVWVRKDMSASFH